MDVWLGMLAGFVATAILSMMMLMKKAMGIMPELDMIGMMSDVTGTSRTVAWIIHFLVGIVIYGVLIAVLAGVFPFDKWITGIIAGAIGWMVASLTFMPAAGKGVFALKIGVSALVMSMMIHIMFGAMLGLIYGWLAA
jgi:hypothetical protein